MTASEDATRLWQERQCGTPTHRKKPFESRAKAKRAARSAARRTGQHKCVFQVYQCPLCESWHVGHAKRFSVNARDYERDKA